MGVGNVCAGVCVGQLYLEVERIQTLDYRHLMGWEDLTCSSVIHSPWALDVAIHLLTQNQSRSAKRRYMCECSVCTCRENRHDTWLLQLKRW